MNLPTKHEVRNVNACKTVKVKDLWVSMIANVKVSEQYRIAASMGTTGMEAI